MLYSTFYARLVPNGGTPGTTYGVTVSGITAVVEADKIWNSGPLLFSIKPKSSGLATVTFINVTTGDILGTKNILVRSTTKAKPTYKLTASATTVNEGGTVTFTLDTSDIAPNANVAYKITGVKVADISLPSLTGNFVIGANGIATLPITIKADEFTDGDKVLKLELVADSTIFKEVNLIDTSKDNPIAYYEGTYNFIVEPGQTYIIDMYPSGGGGGSSGYEPITYNDDGTNGGNIELSMGSSIVTAGGGKAGTGGGWSNGSSYTNGIPGVGGVTDISKNNGTFTILSNNAGREGIRGDRYVAPSKAVGYTSVLGITNDGGVGGTGIGDEMLSYGGSGGSGSNLKVQYTNTGGAVVGLKLVVGAQGKGNTAQNAGGDAPVGHAVVIKSKV